MQPEAFKLLKQDVFGRVTLQPARDGYVIVRDLRGARWWARGLARRLLRREARALSALRGMDGVPVLLADEPERLVRTYVEGAPMQEARPASPAYFRAAAKLLRRLHRHDVVHNDLAKEPNWLVTPGLGPALIDFQLAWYEPGRGRLFRMLAREDLRHLLKHKRTYCPAELSRREKSILADPSWLSRLWMLSAKPLYLFVTRRLLGWADREGAGDR